MNLTVRELSRRHRWKVKYGRTPARISNKFMRTLLRKLRINPDRPACSDSGKMVFFWLSP